MATEAAFDYDDLLGDEASRWRSRLIWLVALGVVLLAVATGVWWQFLRGSSAATAAVQTATVSTGDVTKTVSTNGTVAAKSTSNLNFTTTGTGSSRITKVDVTLGQKVKQGDVLMELDPTNAQTALDSAKLSLSIQQSKLNVLLRGATGSALASADQSVQQSQASYDQAVRALNTLQQPTDAATMETAQQAVTTAQAQLQQARAARAKIDSDKAASVTTAQSGVTKAQNALAAAQQTQANAAAALAKLQPTDSGYAKAQSDKQSADNGVTSAQLALSDANAALASAQAAPIAGQVAVADAAIGSAQAQIDTAQAKLVALQTGPTADALASAQAAVDTAAASLTAAQAKRDETYAGALPSDIQQQQASVSQAQSAVDTAQQNLASTKLIAPFDGTVAALNSQAGDLAGSGTSSTTAAIVLNTPDQVILNMTIGETDYASVKVGQTGTAVFSGIPGRTFPIVIDAIGTNPTTQQGVVSYIAQAHFVAGRPGGPGANGAPGGGALRTPGAGGQGGGRRATAAAATAAAGGTPTTPTGSETPAAGTTPVSPPAAGGARGGGTGAQRPVPGMNATITIITAQSQNVLRVPNAAVQRQGQNRVLEVKQSDGSVKNVTVQVGLSDSTNTEITSGVADGATVVLPGVVATSSVTAGTGTGTGGRVPGGPGGGGFGGRGGGGGG